jgi:hypothetical protein
MKKVFQLCFYLLLPLVFLAIGCNKDTKKEDPKPSPDVTKPVITLLSPSLTQTYRVGDTIVFSARFTDNAALRQAKLEIHDAFDGHTHGKNSNISPFKFERIFDIKGTNDSINYRIPIPATAASGPYHFIVKVTDAAGNEADFVEADLTFTSPTAPVITNVRLDNTATDREIDIDFAASDTLLNKVLTALITDDKGLAEIKVELKADDHEHAGKTAADAIFQHDIDLPANTTSYNLNLTVPFRKAKLKHNKHYVIEITAKDNDGNYTKTEVELHVYFK